MPFSLPPLSFPSHCRRHLQHCRCLRDQPGRSVAFHSVAVPANPPLADCYWLGSFDAIAWARWVEGEDNVAGKFASILAVRLSRKMHFSCLRSIVVEGWDFAEIADKLYLNEWIFRAL